MSGQTGYDILRRIADTRAKRISREGHELGADVPSRRSVPLVAPGKSESGATLICEIKRRSPSRGDIAAACNPAATAREYARLGASGISVLTEADNFGGTLDDLMAVKAALSSQAAGSASAVSPGPASDTHAPGSAGGLAVLRKDFLLDEEDIEISYRAGADMVLLIAALLDEHRLASLYARATQLEMVPLVELYTAEDAEKVREIAPRITGINSRDLTSFRVDRLHPLAVSEHVTWPTELIYESGIRGGEDARLAASAGFSGVLVGESVVRTPGLVGDVAAGLASGHVSGVAAGLASGHVSFAGAGGDDAGPRDGSPAARVRAGARPDRGTAVGDAVRGNDFWSRIARATVRSRPLVKVCGITNRVDAHAATELGADILGFVFADSPRAADEELLGLVADLDIIKVAVVVAGGDREIPQSVRRALNRGLIDAVQLHGDEAPELCAELAFPYYKALRLRGDEDVAAIADYRCPRVLVDAFDRHARGGTGRRIRAELVDAAADAGPLWMAGGIGADNVSDIISRHGPELIDASSLLEAEAGRKDHEKLARFFEEIKHATHV